MLSEKVRKGRGFPRQSVCLGDDVGGLDVSEREEGRVLLRGYMGAFFCFPPFF